MRRLAGPVAMALLLGLAAPALGSLTIGPYPLLGEHCVLQDSDACAGVGPFQGAAGYGYGWTGAFAGDLELDTDAPGMHHAYICTNVVLAGVLTMSPDDLPIGLAFPHCYHDGVEPPSDAVLTLGCTARGTGVAVCSIFD